MPTPPSDPGLLILISLAAGPKHGHAMMLDITDFGGVRLGPGTLYGAITRLEAGGLIAPMAGSGRRRPYRLTRAGRTHLGKRLSALDQSVQTGLARVTAR